MYDDKSELARTFTVIWCLVYPFKNSKFMQQSHYFECNFQGQRKKTI